MNPQSKTVAEMLGVLVVALSATMILTLLISMRGLTVPLILSGVALLVVAVAYASILVPEVTGAPWVPTSRKIVSKALAMAEIRPGELLYDLGSGDGRVVITAAKDFGARAIGVEIDPFRVLYSRLRIWQLRMQDKVRIVRSNFFDIDFRDADIVIIYLEQETNDKLQRKLERELTKTDCRVVSIIFKFEGWEVIKADEEEGIYVYRPRSEMRRA